MPQPADIISPDNASAIVEMAIWSGHACSVFSLAFSPDGKTLVSTSCDQTVRLWDLASGSELRTLEHSTVMIGAVFSPDGKTVAAWSNYAIPLVKLYDVTGASEPRTFTHTARLYTAAFSPDGGRLAVAAADGTVRLWDLASGSELPALNAKMGERYGSPLVVISVSFSPDGKTLASADEDGKVRLWDLASGKVLRSLTITDLGDATFTPDGSQLVVTTVRSYNNASDFEYKVNLYDVASGGKLRSFSGDPDKGDSWALSPDGRTLVVGLRDNTIVVYDVASGRELRRLSGHIHGVYAVAFSPDGRFIASGAGDNDRTIRLWGVYP